MCGIAGIVSFGERPVALEELRTMCSTLAHRGPDDEGFYLGPGAGLGMRRLSIIDLATGHPPIRNEDGSVWVVFNGEIYNYRALRDELHGRGHTFSTATDTEVIVHLYEELGPRCVERMRGMFAFAVWDEERRRLLLARDRLGIKPLYYACAGGRLMFASELKAILALGEVEPRLDWPALGHLLTFGTTPAAASAVQGVRKLEPGHVLVAGPGAEPRTQRYWNVRFEPERGRGEGYFVERLRELLDESVRLHLVSDVPLGAFLSGGVDSSTVVATMARLMSEPVRTFSIGFREPAFDERPWARLVAQTFGTAHREMVVDTDVLDIIDDLAWCLDEPFADSSAIPTYMVSKLAAQEVKVVLSGDGGDELFAGYDKYEVEGRERRVRVLPGPARTALAALARRLPEGARGRNFLRHIALPDADRYLDACTLFRADQVARLLTAEARRRAFEHDPWEPHRRWLAAGSGHWLSALQFADLHTYLPLDILTKVDRMSMAHSLEARVPLLDHVLVEFAAIIPPELQVKGGTRKYILKRAMRGLLPAGVLGRRKRGFAVPLGRWFRGRFPAFARDLLLSERSRQRGIFERAEVERVLSGQGRGQGDLALQLWALISFELWARTFLDAGGRLAGLAGRGVPAGRPSAPAALTAARRA